MRVLMRAVSVLFCCFVCAEDILEISQRFMREPVRILVKRDELTLEGIKQVRPKSTRNMRECVEMHREALGEDSVLT